jgi:hypothetical protein
MARYTRNVNPTDFADLTREQTADFTYRVQQYEPEAPLDKLPTAGLSGRRSWRPLNAVQPREIKP